MSIFLVVVGLVLFLFWLSSAPIKEPDGQEHGGTGATPRRTRHLPAFASELFELLSLVPGMLRVARQSVGAVYRAHRCRALCRDLVENLSLIPPGQIHLIEPTLERLIRDMQQLADRSYGNAREVLQLLYEMRDGIQLNDVALALKDGRLAISALDIKSYVK